MRIKFNYFCRNYFIDLGNINIFYGSNNSGKTLLYNTFINGFNTKDSYFKIDGSSSLRIGYELLYFNSNSTIEEQLKMGTKSILKKNYYDSITDIIDTNNEFSKYLIEKFSIDVNKIASLLSGLNEAGDSKIKVSLNTKNIEDLIISCFQFTTEVTNPSSSYNQELLYQIINDYLSVSSIHKVLIIDDFDLYFDETSTIKILKQFEKQINVTFILFTNKIFSLQYAINKFNIFCIKNKQLFDLTNFKRIIQNSLIEEKYIDENYTLENYLIENHIIIFDDELNSIIKMIKNESFINIGRLLVNNNYSINSNSNNDSIMNIKTNNKIEEKIIMYLDKLLNTN